MSVIVTSHPIRSRLAGAALALALLVGAVSGVSAHYGAPALRPAMDRADQIALATGQSQQQRFVQECEARINLARDLSLYYVWQCVSARLKAPAEELASTVASNHQTRLWYIGNSGIVPPMRAN
jgi:hypothetical protein